jgi:hypothetical protein
MTKAKKNRLSFVFFGEEQERRRGREGMSVFSNNLLLLAGTVPEIWHMYFCE